MVDRQEKVYCIYESLPDVARHTMYVALPRNSSKKRMYICALAFSSTRTKEHYCRNSQNLPSKMRTIWKSYQKKAEKDAVNIGARRYVIHH